MAAASMGFAALSPSYRLASFWALAAKIGTALFEEGLGALLRLRGVVAERQRLEAERADAADVFAVGVERALGDRDRGRREGERARISRHHAATSASRSSAGTTLLTRPIWKASAAV